MRMKKNQIEKLRSRSVSHSDFVPFKVELSHRFIEDLKKLSNAYKLLTKDKPPQHLKAIGIG